MTTHLKRDLSIDLFNLPPLPDERNAMDSYLDIPNNFYILDGKNLRLLQLTDRKEFNRKTISGNAGFVLEIPFLEHAFGTKYYVVDKINGEMMGIFNNKVEVVEAGGTITAFQSRTTKPYYLHFGTKVQGFGCILSCRPPGKQKPSGSTAATKPVPSRWSKIRVPYHTQGI